MYTPLPPILIRRIFDETLQLDEPLTKIVGLDDENNTEFDFESSDMIGSLSVLGKLKNMTLKLHSKGFLDGQFSDFQVLILGQVFRLHRIILVTNDYFASLLSGPFMESDTEVLELQIDNPYVTNEAVSIVFSRIYGKTDVNVNAGNVLAVLACALFFGDKELADDATKVILTNINAETVVDYLVYADSQYYGSHSDLIIDGCFTLLCQEGASSLRSCLEDLPTKWFENVVRSDFFFIKDEFQRYNLIKDVLQQRSGFRIDEKLDPEQSILSKGVIYSHLLFTELLMCEHDTMFVSGIAEPCLNANIIHKALWQQFNLRSRIEESPENVSTLGLIISNDIIPSGDTDKIYGEPLHVGASILDTNYNSETCSFPPFRFSVEFTNLENVHSGSRLSEDIFYAGSVWKFYIQKIIGDDGIPKLGIYVQRFQPSELDLAGTESKTRLSIYIDQRHSVTLWFKIYCYFGNKRCYVLESKPDCFKHGQSWGWRSAKLFRNAFSNGSNTLKCCVVMGLL